MINILMSILFILFTSTVAFSQNFENLLEKMRNDNNLVRIEGAVALAQMGSSVEKKLLAHINDSEQMSRHILWILGEWRDARNIPNILPFLDSSHDLIRTSLVALGKIGDPQTIPDIAKQLKNRSRYIRTDAARALGRIGDVKGIPHLISVENDLDWHIREAVAKSLTEIGGPLAKEHLKKLLDSDPDGVVQAWAHDGLQSILPEK